MKRKKLTPWSFLLSLLVMLLLSNGEHSSDSYTVAASYWPPSVITPALF